MRFCVAIPCFFNNEDFCDSIKKVAELGYTVAETYDWTRLDLDKVKETLDQTGVELLSMCTTEFRLTSPEHRSLWLEGLEKSCIAANKLGVKRLITQVGNDTGAPRAEQHASIVEGLKAGTPILEKYGVTIMIEPLNTIVDHKGYYLWQSSEAFEIIKEVNHHNVKVIFDIYHQQIMEGNIIPNIVNNLDLIAHIHVAGHPGRHEPQKGENNFSFIFEQIKKAGYKEAIGLEYFPLNEPIESLKAVKEIYGEILN